MTRIDWIAVGIIAFSALVGFRRGLIGSALSLGGIVAGAIIGSRLAPHFLHGSSGSRWTSIAALVGAVIGAAVLQTAGSLIGSILRNGLRLTPLRFLDSLIGLVLGAAAGVALVWVLGAAALQIPGQTSLRRSLRASHVLRRLNEVVPPSRLLHAFGRIDFFPSLAGPNAPVAAPSAAVLHVPGVREAAGSVVRVVGTACGFGITGSGWVAAPGLVVTAAHVVAGERSSQVQVGRGPLLRAHVVAYDPRNDLAVLRVPALRARSLRLVDPRPGSEVAIVGYPEDGPLRAEPGRVGRTSSVVSEDAYGKGPVVRSMTTIRGRVRHGNSGGPAIDTRGHVVATIFGAARGGSRLALGVPADVVRRALARARGRVSTGRCAT